MLTISILSLLLISMNIRISLCYLCDVDSRCELRSDHQLCQSKEKSCHKSLQSSKESVQRFVDSTGSGIKGLQGELKLLTGKSGQSCDRQTTLSYSSTGTYKLVLQLQGTNSNLSINIYFPDFKLITDIAPDVNISDHWQTTEYVFVPKYKLFQLVLYGCVEDAGSYLAICNIDLLQLLEDGQYIKACPWDQFSCGDNSCISRDKLCDLRSDCKDGQDENNETCDSLPEGAMCTFDSGLCGWHNVNTKDKFDWKWHKGSTPSSNTGPKQDHTSGNGYYMYIEANGQGLSDFAVLESPTFDPAPLHAERCQVRFHYHMYGTYISYLKLQIINVDKSEPCEDEPTNHLWHLRSNQGDKWSFAAVDLLNVTWRFKLHFIAYVGFKSEGDIAIDDISLSPACFGGCGGTLNSSSGKISAPDTDRDGRYDRNADCRWKIIVRKNKVIKLTFNSMDIESHLNCDNDYIEIFDGMTTNNKSLGKFCGQNVPSAVRSTSNTLLVRFYTDSTVNGAGFDASYVVEDGVRTTADMKGTNRTVYMFGPCGNFGPNGPTQFKCDSSYKATSVKVEVISNGTMKGTQIWTVPENGTYWLSAGGARGGTGIDSPVPSTGAYVEAKFNLTEGEKIYIIVGQPGTSACSTTAKNKIMDICMRGIADSEAEEYLKKSGWGGGGGGGATYVFKYDSETGTYIPLIVAGGGGGQGYKSSHSQKSQRNVNIANNATGNSGFTSLYGSGGGGGWNGTAIYPQAGRSLLEGSTGGTSCNDSFSVSGGFGGGGGACLFGGGGGGLTGGDSGNDPNSTGQVGTSYYHPSAKEMRFLAELPVQSDSFVEINLLINCPCEFWCNISDWDKPLFSCLCRKDQILMSDGYSCEDIPVTLQTAMMAAEVLDIQYIIAIGVSITILFIILTVIPICYVKHKKKHHGKLIRLELNSTPTHGYSIRTSTANGLLPSTILNSTRMIAEYNPNYDFVSANCPEQKLIEINRDNLRLVRALGQGAFGEVYKGLLSGVPNIHGELPVAVKTLSALSTEQAELDFLMEAVIMSKFYHPNIVKFIGVCFDCHPRYIILELLEGGDLKTFLREMRPKPTSLKENLTPSLTCTDLLKIAIDIAKGCRHLEEKHFIHRDIAARNCLLTCKGPNRKCKIADFGMTKDIYRSDYYKKGGKAMLPIKWMPPEAFLDGLFSTKTDVWSFGILLWEIFSMGYMPYPGRTNHDVMQYVTSGGRLEAPEQCPSVISQLMSICWAAIPETRPNFSELIERLERSKLMPEIISAQIPTFYQIPKIPVISTENVVQFSHDLETIEDDEHCSPFIPDSQSKEPLLPRQDKEHSEQLQFISNCNIRFESDNLCSDASEHSLSSESDEPPRTNPVLTDAVTQCNVNLEDL